MEYIAVLLLLLYSEGKRGVGEILERHHRLQEQVAGDMIEMAHSLRAHTETARDIIRSDVKVLQYSRPMDTTRGACHDVLLVRGMSFGFCSDCSTRQKLLMITLPSCNEVQTDCQRRTRAAPGVPGYC